MEDKSGVISIGDVVIDDLGQDFILHAPGAIIEVTRDKIVAICRDTRCGGEHEYPIKYGVEPKEE